MAPNSETDETDGEREIAAGDPAVGFRFAGLSRLGWLIVLMGVLAGGLLWLGRDLPVPAFAARLQSSEPDETTLLVDTAPVPPPSAFRPAEVPPLTAPVPAPAALAAPSLAAAPAVPAPAPGDAAVLPSPASATLATAPPPIFRPPVAAAPRVSVFTVTAPSTRLVYLVDVSGSMFDPLDDGDPQGKSRFEAATDEVRRSIEALPADVVFNVILFADRPVALFPQPTPASPDAKRRAADFLGKLPEVGGGTDFLSGFDSALRMAPDSIFLLTDGGANEPEWKLLREIRALEVAAPASSHLYAFGLTPHLDEDGDRLLEKLCLMSGGSYQPMADWKKAGPAVH